MIVALKRAALIPLHDRAPAAFERVTLTVVFVIAILGCLNVIVLGLHPERFLHHQ